MAERATRQILAEKAIVHDVSAPHPQRTVDRTFELPAGLYLGTAAGYLGFVALMILGFGNPGLVLPMAIVVLFIAMFFGVQAMWMRMKPDHVQQLTPWGRFRRKGVMTAYGHSTANAATVQVLILPVLILVWGLAVVMIAALVR